MAIASAYSRVPERLLAHILDYTENSVIHASVDNKFLSSISRTKKYLGLFETHLVKSYFPFDPPQGDKIEAVYKRVCKRIEKCGLAVPEGGTPDARTVAQLSHAVDRVLFFMHFSGMFNTPAFKPPLDNLGKQVVPRSREIYSWLKENRPCLVAVGAIRLMGFHLSSLPTEIEWFTKLTLLDLRNNNLTRFPTEILDLPLETLELSSNFLTDIHPGIAMLRPTLRSLWLDRNRLTNLPNTVTLLELNSFRIWGNYKLVITPEIRAFCNTPDRQRERPRDFSDILDNGSGTNGAICKHCAQRNFDKMLDSQHKAEQVRLALEESRQRLEKSRRSLEESERILEASQQALAKDLLRHEEKKSKQALEGSKQALEQAECDLEEAQLCLKAAQEPLANDLCKNEERARSQAQVDSMSCWEQLQAYFSSLATSIMQEISAFFTWLFG